MVGEEGEPTRKRGVGHRSSLRRQDSAHTGRYGDTLILPTYKPVVISGVPPPRSPSALAPSTKVPPPRTCWRHSHVVGEILGIAQ
jgi:hypothetical protein